MEQVKPDENRGVELAILSDEVFIGFSMCYCRYAFTMSKLKIQ